MYFLPNDVFRCLSQWLSGYDLILLYLAGCKAINSKLEKTAENFRVSGVQIARQGSAILPLSSFYRFSSLRDVSIVFRGKPARLDPLFILTLPATLESLSLSFDSLLNMLLLPSGHKYACTTELPSEESDATQKNAVLDVGNCFPRLQHLTLIDTMAHTFPRSPFYHEGAVKILLDSMPTALQELRIPVIEKYLKLRLIPLLPPSLLHVVILVSTFGAGGFEAVRSNDVSFEGLPKSITKLSLTVTNLQGTLPLEQLPSTLTRLDLRIYNTPIAENFFEGLPESVTDVEIETSSSRGDIIGLPPSVTRLHLHGITNPIEGQEATLEELEALVTSPPTGDSQSSLSLEGPSMLAENFIENLPRSLHTLIIHFMPVSPAFTFCFYFLPKTLIHLEMAINVDISDIPDGSSALSLGFDFLALLSCLETLRIHRLATPSKISPSSINDEYTSGLPRSLPSSVTDMSWSWNQAVVINQYFMDALPPNLKSLRVGPYVAIPSVMQSRGYPKNLESLVLEDPVSQYGHDLIHYLHELPSSLRTFAISPSPDTPPIDTSALPKRLTSLSTAFKLGDASSLLNLPSNLLYLKIARDLAFGNENVRSLPRTLTYLELASDNSLSDECAELLPRKLVVLAIPLNTRFSIQGIAHIPRTITVLRIRLIRLPAQCPFKTVTEAVNALPPDVDLHCMTSGSAIRGWAESLLGFEQSNQSDSNPNE